MNATIEFLLAGEVGASDIERVLSDRFACTRTRAVRATLRFHDTFDWRLYRAGWVLEEQCRSRDTTLRCYNPGAGALLSVVCGGRARRLPELRSLGAELGLQRLLGPRALMPRAAIPARVSDLALMNAEHQTVVRCQVARCEAPAGAPPFTAVRLFGLPGYDQACRAAAERIATAHGVVERERALLQETMQRLGRTIAGYVTKPQVPLPPSASALDWVRAACADLLEVMLSNEQGIVQDIDTEFLHDLRVAVRRTRSALGRVRGVFSPDSLAPFRSGFAWVGQITGPLRDLDVFLLDFDQLADTVPAELADGLTGLREQLLAQRVRERRRLLRHLRGARYRALLTDWREFLAGPPAVALGPAAGEAVLPLASRQTRRIWRRVLGKGRRIDDGSPPEALHDLRKSCKKLRYMLELFAPLHSARDSARLIGRLKRLQDNLGRFQDCSVQIRALRAIAGELGPAERAQTLLAIGALVQCAAERRVAARRDFAARFARFDRRSTGRLFEGLFAHARSRARC